METSQSREENHHHDENVDTKSVKEIVQPATAVTSEVSAAAALEEMRNCSDESAAVTDQSGKLVGGVSKNQINRRVVGFGHDPQAFPVEPNMDKDVARCFEDQTIGEAEKVMREAKVDQVPVVTQEISLVGKATLEAIEKRKNAAEPRS
jgi:CBS domain-containing protein